MSIERCLDQAANSGYLYAEISNGDSCCMFVFGLTGSASLTDQSLLVAGNVIRASPLALSSCRACVSNPARIPGEIKYIIIYRNRPVVTPVPYTNINGWNWLECAQYVSVVFSLLGVILEYINFGQ